MTPEELRIRAELGIPDDTTVPVVLLGMDAHMDWDWKGTFSELVSTENVGGPGSATSIVSTAWTYMQDNAGPTPYRYSVCEMGFLRAVLEGNPELLEAFREKKLDRQLTIEGGGITSPDNLLSAGEAFIRTYLLGHAWLKATLGLPAIFSYLPDDFGHDAQLPVVLEAMGMGAVAFSRLPGSWGGLETPLDQSSPSLWRQIMDDGSDVRWQASDGSSVLAKVFCKSYGQGNRLKDYDTENAVDCLDCILKKNLPSEKTGYAYLPCGMDFALPIQNLLEIATAWNKRNSRTAYVVVGTLEHYLRLVMEWDRDHDGKLPVRTMDPTPYWTGFYASRPANKILHHATVRALLAAEVFGTVSDLWHRADRLAWAPIKAACSAATAQGWEALVPSTHHDYITGTAVDSVSTEEQLPLLRSALATAVGASKIAIEEIATVIAADPQTGETPVLVANQLGVAARGLVQLPSVPGRTARSVRLPDGTLSPVQTTAEGGLAFIASAPPLGYSTCYLSSKAAGEGDVTVTLHDGVAVLTNSLIRVEVAAAKRWAITSFRWNDAGREHEMVPEDQAANELVFYTDAGDLYAFGNEAGTGNESDFGRVDGHDLAGNAVVIENGPLRGHLRASSDFACDGSAATYSIDYEVVTGEPFVRITVTGSAPFDPNEASGYSVAVRIPFNDQSGRSTPVRGVIRGTPYHWHDKLPVNYWIPPTFQATHRFVVPTDGSAPLGAIYHSDVPAWAIDETGAMIGCILRNAPGNGYRGATGSDHGVHSRSYLLRGPAEILDPATPGLLTDALSATTPLVGAYVNVPTTGAGEDERVSCRLPASFSVASVTSGNAIIMAVKEGHYDPDTTILRVYQPSNRPAQVTVTLDGYIQATGVASPNVRLVTALEQPVDDSEPISVVDGNVTFIARRALTTLAVTRP